MKKKIIIPSILFIFIILLVMSTCFNKGGHVTFDWKNIKNEAFPLDSIELRVFVENSGSMDAYMCPGSNLKDAVFDYVSDIKKFSPKSSLYYINSKIIPYSGDLESFIKNLTPSSFAAAGGDRSNTDLRKIISDIVTSHKNNAITIFVSDCILDIPENALDYFGNCQVSIKNIFNNALSKNPYLGVEIIQLESKFDGTWFCGKNSEILSNVRRPYYIWIIGDQRILAELNSNVDVKDIIGGIKNYCAFSPAQQIPFDFDKKQYVVNHSKTIKPQLLVNLKSSLQSDQSICNISNYKSSNPAQIIITSINKITAKSPYSHVINLNISNPETLKSESIIFTYPKIQDWVVLSNDSTGINVKQNINKTTGILYLIKGVSEAYKSNMEFGAVSFNIKK